MLEEFQQIFKPSRAVLTFQSILKIFLLHHPNALDNLRSLWVAHRDGPMSGSLQKAEGAGSNARQSPAELLPLVYGELRQLAAARLAQEKPGQTLQPTALVHEAWLRLQGSTGETCSNEQEFLAAAARAMRRILVDNARRKQYRKRGGGMTRVEFEEDTLPSPMRSEDLIAVDDALTELATVEPRAAEVIQLRFFAGLTDEAAARALGISRRTADRLWTFGRAWLARAIRQEALDQPNSK